MNMNNKEPGYVYILTNPSFREHTGEARQEFTSCECEKQGTG